jgi:phosphate transport system protein
MYGMSADDPLVWMEEALSHASGSRVRFQERLATCDRALVSVGRTVGSAIAPVTAAFIEADTYAASELIGGPLQVDAECTRLEDACYLLLAREAPVAGDLRRVVAVLRSVADIQRSANLLRHVATALTWIHPPSMPDDLRQTIGQLGAMSGEIFLAGVTAWDAHDGLAANELDGADDQVDLLQKWLLTELYTGRQSVEEAVSLALVARYYERVADHGVEMARQVAYFLTGDRLTPTSH